LIDTLRPVSLPEGVEITLRLAGPLARARAWAFDSALRMVITMSLPALFGWFGPAGTGFMLITMFLVWEVYPIAFEVLWNGATPGKRLCNLAVVNSDGTPVGWPASILRNVLRWADMLPIGYAVGLSSMLLDSQFRRLGDLAAGTVVIHRDHVSAASKTAGAAQPIAPPVALTPLEQRAVLDFAERRRSWSADRAAELAELAVPLVGELRGEAAVTRVAGIAAELVRRR
jgi:uncharacterized RDD family membrane protein YckC